MKIDKQTNLIKYLLNCPQIKNNKLFFNFIEGKDNNKLISIIPSDNAISRYYIDGSISKVYTFSIIDFRSVVYQPVVKTEGYPNENIEEFLDVQGIIDWIDEQNNNRNFPDFGEFCDIDRIYTTTDEPNLNGVDNSTSLAKYSISIKIDYLDKTKMLR